MSGVMDSVDTYNGGNGNGTYGATPFTLGSYYINSAYINKSDGYLYGAGNNGYGQLGIGTSSEPQTSWVKVGVQSSYTSTGVKTDGFYKPIDYAVNYSHSLVIDSDGKVWTAGYNSSANLGWGSSYTGSGSYPYFRTVATSDSGNYLPSNYQAVAVSGGTDSFSSMILTSTGALYGAGRSATLGGASTTTGTFTRIDGVTSLPEATASNPIIDFGGGDVSSWVLYKDGSLYKLTSSAIKMNPTGVTFTMFDTDGAVSPYVYAVSSDNKIYYASENSATTMTYLVTATGTVTQVRGGDKSAGWGYLNSAGALYLTTSANGTPTTSSYYNSGVTYFDLGTCSNYSLTYGIIQNGVTKFWGSNTYGQIGNGSTSSVAVSSPVTPSNVDTSYSPTRDISNTPPATCHLPRK